jgi:hypothetical protein
MVELADWTLDGGWLYLVLGWVVVRFLIWKAFH